MQVNGTDIGNFTVSALLQSATYTLSERGVKNYTWTTQATVFCRIVENNSDTNTINQNLVSQKRCTMMTYDVPNCTDRWRVKIGDDIWSIESVNRELRKPVMNLNLVMDLD